MAGFGFHCCRRYFMSKTIFKRSYCYKSDTQKHCYHHIRPYLGSDITDELNNFTNLLKQIKSKKLVGLPIVHHYGYVSDLPSGHRFAMRKFHGILKYLRQDCVISMNQIITPSPVSEKTASLVHTREYTRQFFTGETTQHEQRRTGFVWNEGLVSRCRLEAGGTLLGCRLALERGLACSTGGGTHHAFPSFGAGFCLINDMAIAARYLTSRKFTQKVLIVDLDVHQGDGTAHIFRDDDSVFTFSMHSKNIFPLLKQSSDLDVPLDDHVQDAAYMEALSAHLPSLLDTVRPDLVIYDAGVDPHILDELGRLDLTDHGLYRRDQYVLESVVSRGIPCMTVVGGGYSRDLEQLSLRHTIVHRAATKVWINQLL